MTVKVRTLYSGTVQSEANTENIGRALHSSLIMTTNKLNLKLGGDSKRAEGPEIELFGETTGKTQILNGVSLQ